MNYLKVIAFYEDHWMAPGTDKAQWDHLCRAFGADLQMIRSWEEAVVGEDEWVILLDETGQEDLCKPADLDLVINTQLSGIVPEKVTMVFGRTAQDLPTALPTSAYDYVFKLHTPNSISMFGVNAAAISLFALTQWKESKQNQG